MKHYYDCNDHDLNNKSKQACYPDDNYNCYYNDCLSSCRVHRSNNPMGCRGPIGPRGARGCIGLTGEQGEIGPTGPQGEQGATGPQGIQGKLGTQGVPGANGGQGRPGETGPTGPWGTPGIMGPAGPPGRPGETGAAGPPGRPGTGPAGPSGTQGIIGPTGGPGLQGETGPTGPQGTPGIMGPIGPQGLRGVTGATGVTGVTGATGAALTATGVSGAIVTFDSIGTGVTGIVPAGFAAIRISAAEVISTDYTFEQLWTTNLPYYNDGNFNTTTGVYTVAVSGIYDIKAIISYTTYCEIGTTYTMPGFAIAINGTNVMWSDMTNFGLIYIWVVGTSILAGQLKLTAGDTLTLRYIANGNNSACYFGVNEERSLVWSIRQML